MSAGKIILSKNITSDFVFYRPKKIYKSKNTFKGFKNSRSAVCVKHSYQHDRI